MEKEGVAEDEAIFFAEKDEVLHVIHQVCEIPPSSPFPSSSSSEWEIVWREKQAWLDGTLSRYQEQPLLLAPHMEEMVLPCTDCILAHLNGLSAAHRSSLNAGFQVNRMHILIEVPALPPSFTPHTESGHSSGTCGVQNASSLLPRARL